MSADHRPSQDSVSLVVTDQLKLPMYQEMQSLPRLTKHIAFWCALAKRCPAHTCKQMFLIVPCQAVTHTIATRLIEDVDKFGRRRVVTLQVVDPVEDYLKLLRTIFDFEALKDLLRKPDFTFTFDGMHGVSGPYARRIFVQVAYFSF